MDRDVVIVGAGVVGAAIARELTRFDLDVTLLEAGPDVGAGTSKANTALLHTGFDAKPGTLEARLVPRGCELLPSYAARAGIPLERTGALLVAWDERAASASSPASSSARGPTATTRSASSTPTSSTAASRTSARARGARSRCRTRRSSARSPPRSPSPPRPCWPAASCAASTPGHGRRARSATAAFACSTPRGSLTTRRLVNAAGLRSDEVDRMLGGDGFTVTPRRGELIVFDKLSRPLVDHIVLAVPTKVSKGVLVSPTVFGNVMVGPTAEDVERKDDTSSTAAGLDYLRREAGRIVPRAARLRGHRRLRRPARRHRARRLPDPLRGRLRLRGRDPLDRAVGVDGDRRARARRARARARAAREPPTLPDAEPRRGVRRGPYQRGRADRARTPTTGASSASASG